MKIGVYLRQKRRESGVTQVDMAKILGIRSQAAISLFERRLNTTKDYTHSEWVRIEQYVDILGIDRKDMADQCPTYAKRLGQEDVYAPRFSKLDALEELARSMLITILELRKELIED